MCWYKKALVDFLFYACALCTGPSVENRCDQIQPGVWTGGAGTENISLHTCPDLYSFKQVNWKADHPGFFGKIKYSGFLGAVTNPIQFVFGKLEQIAAVISRLPSITLSQTLPTLPRQKNPGNGINQHRILDFFQPAAHGWIIPTMPAP